jgi:hypothetical protein
VKFVHAGFLAARCFLLLWLIVDDWMPLDSLNDLIAVRVENTRSRLLRNTLITSAPVAVSIGFSFAFFQQAYPAWARIWFLLIYGALFAGELNAWWIPYFFGARPERKARYRAMFGRTHYFLPERNGMFVNTFHVVLHITTFVTLALAVWLAFSDKG